MPRTPLSDLFVRECLEYCEALGFAKADLVLIHTVLRRRDVKQAPPSATPAQQLVHALWVMNCGLVDKVESLRGTGQLIKEGGSSAQRMAFDALGLAEKLAKKLRASLQKNAKRTWCRLHYVSPFMSLENKRKLATYIGETERQITDFLTNYRARIWRPQIVKGQPFAVATKGDEEDELDEQ